MRTRYRIMFNGLQYKIQYQIFTRTFFGKHWKREWITLCHSNGMEYYVPLFDTKEAAIAQVVREKNQDIENKIRRKKDAALIKNSWIKVWP